MLAVLAPTMIDYAPAELAAEMVPRLLRGEEHWCQGFSEPGSGSDLASLTTRAVQDGDNWIVNGQKVWTSFAQFSTRCVLLTRTAPGYDGITAFFVDLDTPGITIRPLRTMHGVDEFCEVYYDDVVVPAERMLGQPGDGWRLAMDLLPYERSTCFWQRIAYLYSRFDELIAEVCDPDEYELGAAYLALHTLRCRSRATQHRLADGEPLGPQTSIDKVLLAGAEQRLYDTVRDLLPGTLELDDTPWRSEFLYSRAATIYGGTAEIQRNIIARRLLDLGKERAWTTNPCSCSKTAYGRRWRQRRASNSTRRWPSWAGSRCSTKCLKQQSLWCSGCSARPVLMPRYSTTSCYVRPVVKAAARCQCDTRAAPGLSGLGPASRARCSAEIYRYTLCLRVIRRRLAPDGMRLGGG